MESGPSNFHKRFLALGAAECATDAALWLLASRATRFWHDGSRLGTALLLAVFFCALQLGTRMFMARRLRDPTRVQDVALLISLGAALIAGFGAWLTLSLTEGLRVLFGTNFIGAANTIYGLLLILFIIFMPRGLVGVVETALAKRRRRDKPAAAPARP